MRYLATQQIPVKPVEEVANTPGAVALTFDDGFRNFAHYALPILRTYGFPATVFAVSAYCGRRNDWPSQTANSIPELDLMSWRELREVASAGIRIGAHTVSHPFLTRLTDRQITHELRACRQEIEDHIGQPANVLAYPYGNTDERVCKLAGEHFDKAYTTELAPVSNRTDMLRLPRVDVYYLQSRWCFRNLQGIIGQQYLGVRRLLRSIRTQR
jgi:peptidoglycan/xylan/chitin deacetylase (PgdA/CDA1 family)